MHSSYFLLFLFSFINLSYGKDIEIETAVRMGDNFMRKLEASVDAVKKIKISKELQHQFNANFRRFVDFAKGIKYKIQDRASNALISGVVGSVLQNMKKTEFGNAQEQTKNIKIKSTTPTYKGIKENKENVEKPEEEYAAVLGDLIKVIQKQGINENSTGVFKKIHKNFGKIQETGTILSNLFGQKPYFQAQESSQESNDESTTDDVLKVSGEGNAFELLQHLAKQGLKNLKYRRVFLNNQLFLGTDALNMNIFIDHYLKQMTSYWNHISKNKNKIASDFDEELVLLDMIEASNSILYNEQKRMLDVLIHNANGTITDNDMEMLVESINRENIDNKKREMQFLCLNKEICRPFPGYSDYVADLIIEVLKLSDKKLEIFTKTAIKHIKNKVGFLKSLADKKDAAKIAAKLDRMPSFEYFLNREGYAIARSVITSRNKLLKSDSKVLKRKTIAIRMMMDIIDKAFVRDGEEMMSIMFETMTSAIRSWAANKRNDIDTILSNFINKFFVTCESNWNYEVKRDIQILVQVFLRGKSADSLFESRLAVEGSKYLKKPDDLFYDGF